MTCGIGSILSIGGASCRIVKWMFLGICTSSNGTEHTVVVGCGRIAARGRAPGKMARRFDCGVFDGQEPGNGLNNGPAGTTGCWANPACANCATNITPRVRTWAECLP